MRMMVGLLGGYTIKDQTDGIGNQEKEPDVLYRWEARLHRM
jgi:hypothetical protein